MRNCGLQGPEQGKSGSDRIYRTILHRTLILTECPVTPTALASTLYTLYFLLQVMMFFLQLSTLTQVLERQSCQCLISHTWLQSSVEYSLKCHLHLQCTDGGHVH